MTRHRPLYSRRHGSNVITLSLSHVLWLLLASLSRNDNRIGIGIGIGVDAAPDARTDIDYTCYIDRDYSPENNCPGIENGICDNPNHGGEGGEACRNQDCLDCGRRCGAFDADCYGCLHAQGCYYCPGDGTCTNSMSSKGWGWLKLSTCTRESDFLSSLLGDAPESCIADKNSTVTTQDPLYQGNSWMYDMIRVPQVWATYGLTGKGVVIRINDNGVDVNHLEFSGRFAPKDNSCPAHLPVSDSDQNSHGTKVAGILVGNADNDVCAVGIAHGATFSSCNFFADGVNDAYSLMSYKIETFDISQNSIGVPACDVSGFTDQPDIRYEEGCPFTFTALYEKHPEENPCTVCEGEFATTGRSLSTACSDAIATHCKYFYKEDRDACLDFPEFVIGGDCDYGRIPQSALDALELGITTGRNGKGTIFTFAAGNYFNQGDDVNFSTLTNSRYTITVGAVGKDGSHSYYSSPGAALLVTAPAGGIHDIGHILTAQVGTTNGCIDSDQGTSFSCPIVSGVIALLLEANPDLSWRDVQGILAQTSQRVEADTEDTTQSINAAGFWHSNWYGFGIVDAMSAVEAAMNWNLFPEELQVIGLSERENAILSDSNGNELVSTIHLDPTIDDYPNDFVAESTVVLLDLSHYNRGDLEIELTSPSGTKSILHPGKRPEDNQLSGNERWKLMTVRNWGETVTGTWELRIRDLVERDAASGDNNVFGGWNLIVYGRVGSGNVNARIVPTNAPTKTPTKQPTEEPTKKPTKAPTKVPTANPNNTPAVSGGPQNTDSASHDEGGGDEDEPNMSCEAAKLMQPNLPTIEGTIRSAPLSGLNGPCLLGYETVGGWYQVIGSGKVFTLTACSLDISRSVGISVFDGACSQLECVENFSRQVANCETGNGQTISFVSKPGTQYNVLVSGLPVGAGTSTSSDDSTKISVDSFSVRRRLNPVSDFQLEFTEDELHTNDKCESSVPINFGTLVEGNTVGSNTTYKTCQNVEKPGAWYTVTGGTPAEDSEIIYEANTCNSESNFYNTMSVFRGDSCGSSECTNVDFLPCPNGWFGHQVYWSSTSQENFQIFLHSSDVTEASTYDVGSFVMNVEYNNRLANDQCMYALEVELTEVEAVKGTTSGAKPDSNSIMNPCGVGGAGAWHHVNGTGAIIQASTCSGGTDHKTGIQVYSGKCGKLTCIDSVGGNEGLCNDGKASVVNFKSQEGVDYYILVTGREAKTGNFGLHVTEIQPPENNECSAALPLAEYPINGSTLGATIDFSTSHGGFHSTSNCGLSLNTPGVWYTAEGSGRGIEISTCNIDFRSGISIFKGSSCGNLECITQTSVINSNCANGDGVTTSFFGDENNKYYVYIHGESKPPRSTGNYTISYGEFDVLKANAFCQSAYSIPTDGSPVRVSTKNITHASFPLSSGLWYTFQGNSHPFEISACAKDKGDASLSISVFAGGPGGCSSLTFLTGTSFFNNCSSDVGQFPHGDSLSAFRFMTESDQPYYVFVNGREGVGDFDLFLLDGNLTVAPASTAEHQIRQGKDLHRSISIGSGDLVIHTDYLVLDIIAPPLGDASTQGDTIIYIPPLNFSGEDMITMNGCNGEECYRFNVTISVMGPKVDPKSGGLWWLLFLIVVPLLGLPLYLFWRKTKRSDVNDDNEVEGSDTFNDDTFDQEEKGTLLHKRATHRERMQS